MHQVDPKDGYAIGDCRISGQCRVLEFLVPIIHPNKPTQVTITIGNTIFRALDGGREVDWGLVFWVLSSEIGKGGWETKTHPHLPLFVSSLRQLGAVKRGQGVGLPDHQGDGWIPDHA